MPVFTRQSYWLITLTIFTIAVAFIFRSNYLLSFTAATLVAMNLVVLGWAFLAVRGIEVEREQSSTAIEGNPHRVRLIVTNTGRLPRLNLSLFDVFTPAEGDELTEVPMERLGPGETVELEYTREPEVRGEYEIGPLYVAGGDPFGIYNLFRETGSTGDLLVLPAPLELSLRPTQTASSIPKEESATVPREGDSQEFMGVREFRRGDLTRQIHWKLTAKRGELISRQNELHVAGSLNIVLVQNFPEESDLSASHDPLELAVKAAASLAAAARERGYQLGVMRLAPEDVEAVSGFGESNYQLALRTLVKVKGHGEFSIPPLTGEASNRLPGEGATVWIAATPQESDWKALGFLPVTFASNHFLVFDRESFAGERPLQGERVQHREGLTVYRIGWGDDLRSELREFLNYLKAPAGVQGAGA